MDTQITSVNSKQKYIGQILPVFLQVAHGFKYFFNQKVEKTTMLQIQALGLLFKFPNSSAKELGDYLYLSSSATTQLLDRLFQGGWIARKDDTNDRRIIKLSVTLKGREILQQYGKGKTQDLLNIFATLSETELGNFFAILTKINNRMQAQKRI